MRRTTGLRLLLGLCVTLACDLRAPITLLDSGPDQRLVVDGPRPDAPPPDIGSWDGPPACTQQQIPITRYDDPSGHFSLLLHPAVQVRTVGIKNPRTQEAAALLDRGPVAGLALTLPADGFTQDPVARISALQVKLASDLSLGKVGTMAVLSSGSKGKSVEGYPDVKEATWLVSTDLPISPGGLRNFLLASMLNRTYAELSNLPASSGNQCRTLLVKLTLTARSGPFALTAALTDRAIYDSNATDDFLVVDDLGNGTILAETQRKDELFCDQGTIAKMPKADIIWVVDESGSMNDNRLDIVNNATDFFARATTAGLDFRMAVTGVRAPGNGIVMGKFCSRISQDQHDDGGDDRFLLPSEKAIFSSCVQNPPYYEGGSEWGLTNAYHAIVNHLPRQAASPSHVRADALLAVIIATDETPLELKPGGQFHGQAGFLSYDDYKGSTCALEPQKQQTLNTMISPFIKLVTGTDGAGGKAFVHLLGGVCNNICKAEASHGYNELVQATSGQVGDICQANLSATLQIIINSITAQASPQVLKHRPVSGSLALDLTTGPVKRSRVAGFMYNVASNSITWNGLKVQSGQMIRVAYRRFIP